MIIPKCLDNSSTGSGQISHSSPLSFITNSLMSFSNKCLEMTLLYKPEKGQLRTMESGSNKVNESLASDEQMGLPEQDS